MPDCSLHWISVSVLGRITLIYSRRCYVCSILRLLIQPLQGAHLLFPASEGVTFELPDAWLWDILDEYIYQFQAFCQYKHKIKAKTQEEMDRISSHPDVRPSFSLLLSLLFLIMSITYFNRCGMWRLYLRPCTRW